MSKETGIVPRWLFNKNEDDEKNISYYGQPTSEEKWWTSLLFGLVFFLLSNTYTYWFISKVLVYFEGMSIAGPPMKVHLIGSLLLSFIFVIIVRLILI